MARLAIIITLIAAACATQVVYEPAPAHGRIVRWIDGDTCEIEIDGGRQTWNEKVRIHGVDTPERGDPGFNEATESSRKEWPAGSNITLTYPERRKNGSIQYRDNFGRLLATLSAREGGEE